MVDADLVAAKLAELAELVARVRKHRTADAEGLREDRDARDLVSFNLMLAVQTCADVASHVVADEGWPPARDLAGGFQRLQEHGVVAPEVARRLAQAVGLRNVVAHVYAEVDVDLLFEAATAGLGDLERFAEEVARWTAARRS